MKIFAVGVMVFAGVMAAGCGDDSQEKEAGEASCVNLVSRECSDYSVSGYLTISEFVSDCAGDVFLDKACADLPHGACASGTDVTDCFDEVPHYQCYWGVFIENEACSALAVGRCRFTSDNFGGPSGTCPDDTSDAECCLNDTYEASCKELFDGVFEADKLCSDD